MWPFRKRLPQTVEEQAVMSPHGRFNPGWTLTYEAKRLPSPGTQNYAYENLGLVEYSPIGPSESNRMQLKSTQPRPAYALFAVTQRGVGGLVMGTIYGQPLIAPSPPVEDQIHG